MIYFSLQSKGIHRFTVLSSQNIQSYHSHSQKQRDIMCTSLLLSLCVLSFSILIQSRTSCLGNGSTKSGVVISMCINWVKNSSLPKTCPHVGQDSASNASLRLSSTTANYFSFQITVPYKWEPKGVE